MHRSFLIFATVFFGVVSQAAASECRTAAERAEVQVILDVIEAFNHNDMAAFANAFDDSAMATFPGFTTPVPKAVTVAFYDSFRGPFPDIQIELAGPLLVENSRVTLPYRVTGTQTGALVTPGGTIPPTGQSVSVEANAIFEFSGNKIVRLKDEVDQFVFFKQLGLALPPTYGYARTELAFTDNASGRSLGELAAVAVVRLAVAALNAHSVPAFLALTRGGYLEQSAANDDTPFNRLDSAAFYEKLFAGIPDFHVTIEAVSVERNVVTVVWHANGTHTGVLQTPDGPVAGSGASFETTGTSVFTVRGGKLFRVRHAFDLGDVLGPLSLLAHF
jgi:predicted ester cyclase